MDECKQRHNEYREFFKHCTTTVPDIYSQKQTKPVLYMEEGTGRAATLYLMGQYGRVLGIHLWHIDNDSTPFVVETKNQLKTTDFRLYIGDSCTYDLVDIMYMVMQVCGYDDAMVALNEYCDTYDKPRPRNLLSSWDNDPNWYLLQTQAGEDFMTDHQLEFKPATEENPLNELTMYIPTTPGEYTVQKIQTGVRGRLSIHSVDHFKTAMLVDPAVGLSSMFAQYLSCMNSLSEIKGISQIPTTTRYLFKHIAPHVGKCIPAARTLSRFGVTTNEDITKTIHALMID